MLTPEQQQHNRTARHKGLLMGRQKLRQKMNKQLWVSAKLMRPRRREREPVDDDEREKIKEHGK